MSDELETRIAELERRLDAQAELNDTLFAWLNEVSRDAVSRDEMMDCISHLEFRGCA